MAAENEIDIQEVMSVIRQRAEARRKQGESSAPLRQPAMLSKTKVSLNVLRSNSLAQLQSKIASVRLTQAEVGAVNPRPPGVHNRAIQLVKKAIQRSLGWYTRSLVQFDRSVVEAFEAAQNNILELQQANVELSQARTAEIQELWSHVNRLMEHDLRQMHDRIAQITQSIEGPGGLNEKLRANERSIRRVSNVAQPSTAHDSLSQPVREHPHSSSGVADFDYFLFEERFRGNETIIKERQKSYLALFQDRDDVVDLGCGRGEFLEILRENRIPARGAETNTDMFLLCREKGLNVVQQDLFSFLDATPDTTLGGIFCSQVIEHLTVADQLRLVNLAKEKTRPGSPVVLETINPECVFALVRNFFLDPTHIRPVHPEMLKFACESAGFAEVTLRFSEAVTSAQIPKLPPTTPELEAFNAGIERVNAFLYGYQDYAVVALR